MFPIRRKAHETLDQVSTAAVRVTTTSELATIALLAVAAVSVLALGVAVIALATARACNGK